MSSSFLEIVELPTGEIVLRRSDEDDEPLVGITFSEEARDIIGDSGVDVAKVMIQAGIQATMHMHELQDEQFTDEEGEEPKVLH